METERERERESALAFSFLVHKIRLRYLDMHDSFLSLQVLFLFSRQDIPRYLSPTEVLQRSVFCFYSFIMYLGGLH